MSDTVTTELIYEILKKIQGDLAHVKASVDDHSQQFIRLREQLHELHRSLQGQVHDLQSDTIRLEKGQGTIRHDVDRIKHRLELHDAE